MLSFVIPEDPIVPDPTEFPPIPPRNPNEPPSIEEPAEPGIPLEDPPVDRDSDYVPDDQPIIEPPAQANC